MKKIIIPCILSLLSHSAFSAPILQDLPTIMPADAITNTSSATPVHTSFLTNIQRNNTHFSANIENLNGIATFFLANILALEMDDVSKEYHGNIGILSEEACSWETHFENCYNMTVTYQKMNSLTQAAEEDFATLSLTKGSIELAINNKVTFDNFYTSLKTQSEPEPVFTGAEDNRIQKLVSDHLHLVKLSDLFSVCLFESLLKNISCIEIYEHLLRHLGDSSDANINFDSLKSRGQWTVIGKSQELTAELISPLGLMLLTNLPHSEKLQLLTSLSTTSAKENQATLDFHMEEKSDDMSVLQTTPYATLTLTPGTFELKIRRSGVLTHFVDALKKNKAELYKIISKLPEGDGGANPSLAHFIPKALTTFVNHDLLILNLIINMVTGKKPMAVFHEGEL